MRAGSLDPHARGAFDAAVSGRPVFQAVFWIYKRVLSPTLHAFGFTQCRYLPTCSEYAYVALDRFGVLKGTWLALRRVGRCHPWAKGGLDPVPEA